MSTEQPVPPSIPPRARPAHGGAPVGPAGPVATAPGGGPAAPSAAQVPQGTTPTSPAAPGTAERPAEESAMAGSRARAAAAGGAAAGAVRRVVRGATAAAVGAASGSGGQGAPAGAAPQASAYGEAPDAASGPRPAAARPDRAAAAGQRDAGPRRVRLNLSRVDPWSVMKLSFLLSFAIGIMIVVAAVVVWFALDSLAVFTTINDMLTEIVGQESPIDILGFLDLSRVVSGAFIIAIVDVVLLTALSTIGAFLYNITAALVGGVTVTLTDE